MHTVQSHFQRGAFCSVSKRYFPADSVELDRANSLHLTCPICQKRAILRRGKVRIAHFAHRKRSECSFYDDTISKSAQESFLHKHCKLVIADRLNHEGRLNISIPCGAGLFCKGYLGSKNTDIVQQLECSADRGEHAEVEFRDAATNKVYDVAVVATVNGVTTIKGVVEIKHTHFTEEGTRPEPWFELATEDIMQGKIRCIRAGRPRCMGCLPFRPRCKNFEEREEERKQDREKLEMNKEELIQWISDQPDGRWLVPVDCGCNPVVISQLDKSSIEKPVDDKDYIIPCEGNQLRLRYPFEREKGAPKVYACGEKIMCLDCNNQAAAALEAEYKAKNEEYEMNREELVQWISDQPDGRWPVPVDCGCDPVFLSLSDIRTIETPWYNGEKYRICLHDKIVCRSLFFWEESVIRSIDRSFCISYPFERDKGAPLIQKCGRLYCYTCQAAIENAERKVRQGLLVRAIRGCDPKVRRSLKWSSEDRKHVWDRLEEYKESGVPDDLDIWLNVSYSQKEEAKRLGARWDAEQKLWYHPGCNEGYNDTLDRTEIISRFGKTRVMFNFHTAVQRSNNLSAKS